MVAAAEHAEASRAVVAVEDLLEVVEAPGVAVDSLVVAAGSLVEAGVDLVGDPVDDSRQQSSFGVWGIGSLYENICFLCSCAS